MSTSLSNLQPSPHTPNFDSIFEMALKKYKKKTGKDLTAHPLPAEIKGCASPQAILTVLEEKLKTFVEVMSDSLSGSLQPWISSVHSLPHFDRVLAWWVAETNHATCLCPDVNFQVFPPTTIIFSGISILLVVSFLTHSSACAVITPSLAGGKEHCGKLWYTSWTLQQNWELLPMCQDLYRSPTDSWLDGGARGDHGQGFVNLCYCDKGGEEKMVE